MEVKRRRRERKLKLEKVKVRRKEKAQRRKRKIKRKRRRVLLASKTTQRFAFSVTGQRKVNGSKMLIIPFP